MKSSKSVRPSTTPKRVAIVESKSNFSAKEFLEQLKFLANEDPGKNAKFVRDENASNKYLGVRIAEIFELAKHYKLMPIDEIRKLLNNDYYEVRLGAVSIMDFLARDKKSERLARNARAAADRQSRAGEDRSRARAGAAAGDEKIEGRTGRRHPHGESGEVIRRGAER